eukprot:scaffold20371_cov102-Isochrysis_galbana.AAC.11
MYVHTRHAWQHEPHARTASLALQTSGTQARIRWLVEPETPQSTSEHLDRHTGVLIVDSHGMANRQTGRPASPEDPAAAKNIPPPPQALEID